MIKETPVNNFPSGFKPFNWRKPQFDISGCCGCFSPTQAMRWPFPSWPQNCRYNKPFLWDNKITSMEEVKHRTGTVGQGWYGLASSIKLGVPKALIKSAFWANVRCQLFTSFFSILVDWTPVMCQEGPDHFYGPNIAWYSNMGTSPLAPSSTVLTNHTHFLL